MFPASKPADNVYVSAAGGTKLKKRGRKEIPGEAGGGGEGEGEEGGEETTIN